ncbi:MAG: hypothetical protein E7207_00400 [Clostridium butyricum]|nr:hypothetical protein [Clostridium butyricum]
MNFLLIIKLKADIIIRKQLLNLFLILFSPTNSLTVLLSQNLDKYIVKHQKQLFLIYNSKHTETDQIHKFIA